MLRTSATTHDVGPLPPAHTRSASSATSGAPVPLQSVLTSLAGGWWYFRFSIPVWWGRTWPSLASGAHDSRSRVQGWLDPQTRRPAGLRFPGARFCLLFHSLRLSAFSFLLLVSLSLPASSALDCLPLYYMGSKI